MCRGGVAPVGLRAVASEGLKVGRELGSCFGANCGLGSGADCERISDCPQEPIQLPSSG